MKTPDTDVVDEIPKLADILAMKRRLEAADVRRNPFEVPPWSVPDFSRAGPEWTEPQK